MESHPFTISTPSEVGDGVTLVVRRAGDWTRAVYDLAMRTPGGVQVRCSIEGPYGTLIVLYSIRNNQLMLDAQADLSISCFPLSPL